MRLTLAVILFVLTSCSLITKRKTVDESQISDLAKNKISEARSLIKEDKLKMAIGKLSELNDNTLSPLEKSLKYNLKGCLLYTSPSPRDRQKSRMPSSA